MEEKKITLTLIQGAGNFNRDYTVKKITNSVRWKIGEELTKGEVVDIIDNYADTTVKIEEKKKIY